MVAVGAIVVYFQSTSNFPSWQEELRERAEVKLALRGSPCVSMEARETS
jgi:hypothetical protein